MCGVQWLDKYRYLNMKLRDGLGLEDDIVLLLW